MVFVWAGVASPAFPIRIARRPCKGGLQNPNSPDGAPRRPYFFEPSRISTRRIFPLMVLGSSFTNSTTRGYL